LDRSLNPVLINCSDPKRGAKLANLLRESDGFEASMVTHSGAELESVLKRSSVSCVIAAFVNSEPNDFELVAKIQRASKGGATPVILVVDAVDSDLRKRARIAGAAAVIGWPSISSDYLSGTVDYAISYSRLMRVVDMQNEQMRRVQESRANQRHYTEMFAHELLTPLASVQEFVSLVFDEISGPINSEQASHLAYARGGCTMIKQSIDNLVAATEIGEMNPMAPERFSSDFAKIAAIASGQDT